MRNHATYNSGKIGESGVKQTQTVFMFNILTMAATNSTKQHLVCAGLTHEGQISVFSQVIKLIKLASHDYICIVYSFAMLPNSITIYGCTLLSTTYKFHYADRRTDIILYHLSKVILLKI